MEENSALSKLSLLFTPQLCRIQTIAAKYQRRAADESLAHRYKRYPPFSGSGGVDGDDDGDDDYVVPAQIEYETANALVNLEEVAASLLTQQRKKVGVQAVATIIFTAENSVVLFPSCPFSATSWYACSHVDCLLRARLFHV